jgi:hypothetical protein
LPVEKFLFSVKNTPISTFVNELASLTGLQVHKKSFNILDSPDTHFSAESALILHPFSPDYRLGESSMLMPK